MEIRSNRRYWFEATPEAVWSTLGATGEYRRWWPWLRTFEADAMAAGEHWRCTVRPPLPYSVSFTIELQTITPPTTLVARVRGDIAGTARIDLAPLEGGCDVQLTSALAARGRALRVLTAAARPVARFGHDWILDTGARQFAARALDNGPVAPRR